jgi:hypothetical protein
MAGATDGIDFLKGNIQDDEFVLYATPGGTFIHSILVPAANVNPPDVEDLMAWSFNAYGTWGVSYTLADSPRIWLDAPFKNSGTKSFEGGSRLIFPRDFEGRAYEAGVIALHTFVLVRAPMTLQQRLARPCQRQEGRALPIEEMGGNIN